MTTTKTKFLLCNVCSTFTTESQNAIFCDICCTWIHSKCAKLTRKDLILLSSSPNIWICRICLITIFPFSKLTKTQLQSLSFNSCLSKLTSKSRKTKNTPLLNTTQKPLKQNTKCPVCVKQIQPNQLTIQCNICLRNLHIKCTHLTHTESLIPGGEQFSCYSCISCCFPFMNENNLSQ